MLLYAVCRKHGMSLGDFGAKHPADRRFMVQGYQEYAEHVEDETPNV